MSSVTFSTSVGGDGSTVTDDDNATTGLGNGGALIRLVPMMQQVVNVAAHVVSVSGGAGDDAAAASASAAAASSSATAAAASYDSFDDRYLGSKTSDPSVDNDGNTLLVGALYWNSTSSVMKVWTGSTWTNPNPATGYLALSGGTMTGAITFAAGQFGTNVNTFLTTPSSANLAAALTDATGTGVNVFNNTPTLITPILGTPQSGNLANCTFPTLNQNTSGYAEALKSATTTVSVSSASAPSVGQVLMATSSTDATWQTAPSGALTLLSTVTASSSSTVDIETTFNSTYDAYLIVASGVTVSAGGGLYIRFKINGTYVTVDYQYITQENVATEGTVYNAGGSTGMGQIKIASYMTNGANDFSHFEVRVYKPTDTSHRKYITYSGVQGTSAGVRTGLGVGGYVGGNEALSGVRFYHQIGTIVTGSFRLYGISN